MALNTHMSQASWNLGLDSALNVLNSGYIEIYDSTGTGQPATPDVAVTTQVKLAKLTLNATAFGASAAGTKTANSITSSAALATGTATWFRAFKSDDATAVIDGTVATSGGDMTINTTSIVNGGTVAITAWTVSMPTGQ
jgi:hypothetical protein